jgi:uncharacterized membrane protein YhaH (DUF805 family)
MNFTQAVKTCLMQKYVEFSGRAGRPEFWWFFLFQFLAMMVATVFGEVAYWLVAIALLLPNIGVAVRRLHDIGKSGWFLLLGLIPLLGFLVLIYFWVQPSGPANAWGAAPDGAGEPAALPPGAV